MNQYQFKPVSFAGVREVVKEPVAAAVRKSGNTRLTIRLTAEMVKKCGFKDGDMLTPFLDEANKTVLLLSDQRPQPKTARKLTHREKSQAAIVEFPRVGAFAELFPIAPNRAMILRESSHGRLVFTVPNVK